MKYYYMIMSKSVYMKWGLKYFNGRILKANLSWTRKKSISSDAKIFPPLSLNFFRLSGGKTTDKLELNKQNIDRVGLQLDFAFRIWP